jgi:hypothetical protein
MPGIRRRLDEEGNSNYSERYAVTFAVPDIFVDHSNEVPGHSVVSPDGPSVAYDPRWMLPTVRYIDLPTFSTGTFPGMERLDKICSDAVLEIVKDSVVHNRLYTTARDKLVAGGRLLEHVQDIVDHPNGLKGVLFLANAYSKSSDKDPYVDISEIADVCTRPERVATTWMQLQTIVRGLIDGNWREHGQYESAQELKDHISDMYYAIDPRSARFHHGAQEDGGVDYEDSDEDGGA